MNWISVKEKFPEAEFINNEGKHYSKTVITYDAENGTINRGIWYPEERLWYLGVYPEFSEHLPTHWSNDDLELPEYNGEHEDVDSNYCL